MKTSRLFFVCLLVSLFFWFVPKIALAVVDYDIDDPNSFNSVIVGAGNGARLGNYNVGYGNFDNDGKTDLVLTEYSSPHDVYVVLGSSLTEDFNQEIDLSDPSTYFIRYSPVTTSEYNLYYTAYGADLDGDGIDELIIGNDNATVSGVSHRGVMYIIYDSLLQSYSGTGNNVSLASSSNWNIKLMGESADGYFGASFQGLSDLNQDSLNDLVVTSTYADYSYEDAGSAFVIYSTLLNSYSGSTGTILTMADPDNYHLRIDGPLASSMLLSYNFGPTYDYDNDGKDDLLLIAAKTDYSELDAGSYYLLSNTLIDDYSGTGNTLDLSNAANFNLRIDSTEAYGNLGYSLVSMGDVNNNGKTDLVLSAAYASNLPASYDGTIFLVYDDIIDNFTGLGNTMSLLEPENYTMKYMGKEDDIALGESNWLEDYDNDGKLDLITHDYYNVYVLHNDLLAALSGTGSTEVLGNAGTYSYKFSQGPNSFISSHNLADVNGDGSTDFVITDIDATLLTRTNPGANYVILNFPHSISLNPVSYQGLGNSAIISGTLASQNSVSAPKGVQFLIDAQNPDNPNWANCTADDGTFDTGSEVFTCQVSNLSSGNHTLYIRAYDEKVTYTAASRYSQVALSTQGNSATNQNTSSIGDRPLPPSCTALKPSTAPELFQIKTTDTSATLYFVPVVGNTDSYFIRYGTSPTNFEHGYEFNERTSEGVLVRQIDHLKAQTPYYFQVRAGNGCMPGDWGNTLGATTTSLKDRIRQFYLYLTKQTTTVN